MEIGSLGEGHSFDVDVAGLSGLTAAYQLWKKDPSLHVSVLEAKGKLGSGVAEWARALTGDRTVNGSSPAAVKTFRFASELWQFRLPRLASVFRMRH